MLFETYSPLSPTKFSSHSIQNTSRRVTLVPYTIPFMHNDQPYYPHKKSASAHTSKSVTAWLLWLYRIREYNLFDIRPTLPFKWSDSILFCEQKKIQQRKKKLSWRRVSCSNSGTDGFNATRYPINHPLGVVLGSIFESGKVGRLQTIYKYTRLHWPDTGWIVQSFHRLIF